MRLPLLILLYKVYVELKVGNKERHTCLAYFAKSKTESTGDSKSYKNDQDVQVCGMKVETPFYDFSLLNF